MNVKEIRKIRHKRFLDNRIAKLNNRMILSFKEINFKARWKKKMKVWFSKINK
jgi:hypothetical protein